MSGQISGQVPNQAGVPHQNGNPLPNLGGQRMPFNMDPPEIGKIRRFMQDRILRYLMQRHQHPTEAQQKKVLDIVQRLEGALFKNAATKEEYMNLDTLEGRLHVLIKRLPQSNHNQQYPQLVNGSSPSISTMIPTPGMPQNGNSNLMVPSSSVDTAMIASTNSNTGSMLPTAGATFVGIHGGSFNSSDGPLSNGHPQPSNFSVGSSGNNMTSSMGGQRMTSQMIPTPGFSSNINNQSYMNSLDSSNNTSGAFSNVESMMVSQPNQQKQNIGGNSRILHNLGSQMGSGIRSGMQQKSYGYPNGALNGGLGMIGSNLNMQMVNGSGTSEGYLTGAAYDNSPKPLQQLIDPQHQRQLMQGDGFGMSSRNLSGTGNLYGQATVGSMMNSQSLNQVNMQQLTRTNSSLMVNQSNMQATQHGAHIKSQQIERSEKMNLQAQDLSHENLLQSRNHQQFQQQPNQFQQQQLLQLQQQQKQQNQLQQHNRVVIKNEAFSQVNPEQGIESRNEVLHPQASEQFQLPESQNQFQQDIFPANSQNSQQMQQLLHQNQMAIDESQNDLGCLSVGSQAESLRSAQWHHNPAHSQPQQIQDDFRQKLAVENEAQRNNLSSNGSNICQAVVASRNTGNPREKQYWNQQKWLLFLFHARRCSAPAGKCQESHCINAQRLLSHIDRCSAPHCRVPRCLSSKALVSHYKICKDPNCPVCIPVNDFIKQRKLKSLSRPHSDSGFSAESGKPCKTAEDNSTAKLTSKTSQLSVVETSENLQSSPKRIKMEHLSQSLVSNTGSAVKLQSRSTESNVSQDGDVSLPIKSEYKEVKMESVISGQGSANVGEMESMTEVYNPRAEGASIVPKESAAFDQESRKFETEIDQVKQETVAVTTETAGTKSGKPKIKGVSLTELFTPEQIREHITGLRQWVGQSKAKAEKNQAMEHSMSENSCQLCAVEKLTFEPPPTYCTPCGARIKRNAMYYTVGTGDTRHYFCIPCYNEARGDTILVDGTSVLKARLEKKKNDEETEEWWVQCDKCEAWQHQICALFNGRRNDGGQAEYTCPNCYMQEIERGERKPLPQSAVLGAKDLPRTILSDHIEHRLFKRLKQERQERARIQGKTYDEVPGAEALVIRVVSSVDKKLEVKQRFLEIFQEENYPTEFPYKSKVILLFQKIEGVEVCLFGMYVQEFGSECQFPNQRRVYLSYLDSVKYFRPEIKAVTGEALRTFVYHEILIGYLEYCKKRGFTSCYIWACPPLKGEDYILYCHPEIQKTPKSDKLREWYLAMLRKAAKENIVVDLTNLYDHFFIKTGECKARVTAARLPYFDGDYWPGAAEDIIYQLQQEEDGKKLNKKGTTKKTLTKRALKASGQTDLSGNASKDLLLMRKLGETISPMKEDFIMVHLQHACTHCCHLMVCGNRWVCGQCKTFQLCDRCYDDEQKLEDRDRHPINQRDRHELYRVEINVVQTDTKDKDEILESEFFDTRQAFLSLCQGNHYQYDTLRRAKHSSMMVLYHLHNPTAPAFVTTCNICYLDIETGQGWRCEVCPDYDVCNACFQKDVGIDHPHKLTNHPSMAERDAQNKEARQVRVVQLRKMLDLLVHASQCRSAHCQYPNCRKVKGLFRHGIQCKTRASGGCHLCKKMWYLLQLHARACKESECSVPRCRDLKEHLRRLQQQSDSRRRAAVMEMMRQRAAEVAGNSG